MGHILKGKEGQGKRAHISGVPSRGHIYHFHIIISGEIGKWGTHFRGKFWARGSMINLFVYCSCWSRWSMDVEKKRSECWSRKKNQKCSKSRTKSVYPFCKLYFCKTLWIMLLKSRLFFHQILIMLFKTRIFFGLPVCCLYPHVSHVHSIQIGVWMFFCVCVSLYIQCTY